MRKTSILHRRCIWRKKALTLLSQRLRINTTNSNLILPDHLHRKMNLRTWTKAKDTKRLFTQARNTQTIEWRPLKLLNNKLLKTSSQFYLKLGEIWNIQTLICKSTLKRILNEIRKVSSETKHLKIRKLNKTLWRRCWMRPFWAQWRWT